MVVFPNAKINIGLNIVSRRHDGYHNIESVMIPIGWHDILEIVPAKGPETTLNITGRNVACETKNNLVIKAYDALLKKVGNLPKVDIFLHKVIPDGAGLGGGSSDAAFTIKALDKMFSLGLNNTDMAEIASTIGADCPFFIYNRPMYASEIGTTLKPVDIKFDNMQIVVSKIPGKSVSTSQAYASVIPRTCSSEWIDEIIQGNIPKWKNIVKNDFEKGIFLNNPDIELLKTKMYESGAIYASMSGSGSAVYGIFNNDILADEMTKIFTGCDLYIGRL